MTYVVINKPVAVVACTQSGKDEKMEKHMSNAVGTSLSKAKQCCDPMGLHNKRKILGLRKAGASMIQHGVQEGDWLCHPCRVKIQKQQKLKDQENISSEDGEEQEEEVMDDDQEDVDVDEEMEKLDRSHTVDTINLVTPVIVHHQWTSKS